MDENTLLPLNLPAIARKKVSAAFNGGRIASGDGVMLLAQAERRLGIADQLAAAIPGERDAGRVTHLLPDILGARIFVIACGYEDGNDLHRPQTRIAIRSDGRYGRPEVMERCDENGVDFVFGLPGNAVPGDL